jgi:hypothetical protein
MGEVSKAQTNRLGAQGKKCPVLTTMQQGACEDFTGEETLRSFSHLAGCHQRMDSNPPQSGQQ